jgi:hypothetical protein
MIQLKVKYTGRIRFPFKIRDYRLQRQPFGRGWVCEQPSMYYCVLTLLPVFRYYVSSIHITDDDKVRTYAWGLSVRLGYWTIELMSGTFKKPYKQPWIETIDHKFLQTYKEYEKELGDIANKKKQS